MSNQKTKKLSTGVLELKFMKKSKEKARIEDANEQQQLLYADQLSTLNNTTDKVVLMETHFDLMSYLPCRLSFGGFEPSIEKINQDKLTGIYEVIKEVEETKEEDVDVTKEEMAEHFSSLNETLAKKFNKRKSDQFEDDDGHQFPKPNTKRRTLINMPDATKKKFKKPAAT